MTMEKLIRERHELEDRVRRFVGQVQQYRREASLMDVRSLEILMAKLVDLINASSNEQNRIDFQFKGLLLKQEYDAKLNSIPVKRGFFRRAFDPTLPMKTMIHWNFKYPLTLTESSINEWSRGESLDPSRLLRPPQ